MPRNRHSSKKNKKFEISDLISWLKKNPIPVVSSIITTLFLLLGGINDIAEFLTLWQSNNNLVIFIIIGLLYIFLFVLSIFVIIKKPKFSWFRNTARYILILIPITLLLFWINSIYYHRSIENKFVILITRFEGPDPEQYRVTEIIRTNLVNATKDYDDIVILKSSEEVKEDDGSSKARSLGKQSQADLVIWGWYGVTETDTLVTVNVESFGKRQYVPLDNTAEYQLKEDATEIRSFKTQQRLSNQLTAFSIFISGLTRLEVGDFQTGIDRLSACLKIEEWSDNLVNKAIVYFYRGTAYLEMGRYDAAIEDFNLAENINPFCLRCLYINRGIAYSLVGNYEKSMEDLTLASVDESTMKGILYRRKGDYEKAITEYSDAIEIDDKNFSAYMGRGHAYDLIEKNDLALSDYNSAFAINPESSSLLYNRGLLHKEMGNFPEAINDLNQSIELDPNYYYAYYQLGETYREIREFKKALDNFNKAIVIDSNIFCAYLGRGWTYLLSEEYSKATDDFHQMLRIDETLDGAYYGLALVEFDKGQYKNSIPYFDKAIELGASYPGVYIWRSRSYLKLNDYKNALGDVEKAISLDANNYEYYSDRAEIYEGLGETDKAIMDYQQSLRIKPTSYNYCSLGVLYSKDPMYHDLAIFNLEQGIKLNDMSDLDWCKEELNKLQK